MNYLAEILAFSEWKEVNPLPASAIALWHELMAICNKAGWLREFTVPNGLLQAKCGLSRKEFDHARSVLINFERIKYKKSERVNQAGKYMIIPFVQKGQQGGQQKVQQKGQREEHTGGNVGGTLYKLKHKHKHKLKQHVGARDEQFILLLSQLVNRPLGSRDKQIIDGWLDDGVDTLVAVEAVKKAIVQNADAPIIYADKIVIDWDKRGLKTIGAVLEFLKQEKKLSKREQDDIERRRLTEEYDRKYGKQNDRVVQSKLPSVLRY